MDAKEQEAVDRFIEQIGVIAQADGLPRIAGRMIALLVLEAEPLGFADLARRLGVSRASVSTNTRMLESFGVIERTSKSGERQIFFQLTRDPYLKLLSGAVARAERSLTAVRQAQRALPETWEGTQRNLEEMGAFYQEYTGAIHTVIERLRHEGDAS